MKLNNFTGGLKTRVSPNLLSINEAQVCTNVDLLRGSIAPIKTDLLYSSDTSWLNKVNFYLLNGVWVKKNSGTSFVMFDNRLYFSQGSGDLKYTSNGTTEYSIGISKPPAKLTIASTLTPVKFTVALSISTTGAKIGDVITVNLDGAQIMTHTLVDADVKANLKKFEYTGSITSASNLTALLTNTDSEKFNLTLTLDSELREITYMYTYYSSVTGFESAASPFTENVEIYEGSAVTVSGFAPSVNSTVDTIRVYRLGGDLTNFTLVGEKANTSAAFTDNFSDTAIAGNDLMLNFDFIPPPQNLNYLTLYSFSLFASNGNVLYFSNYASPDQWSEFNSFNFPDSITGMGSTQNGLLVFTRNQTYLIRGTDSSNFSKTLIHTSLGCVTHSTIQYLNNNLVWLSTDGILGSNGASITNITEVYLGRLSITPYNSVVYNSQYFLFHSTGTIVVDLRTGVAKIYNIDTVYKGAHYSYLLDSLFMYTDDTIVKFSEGTTNRALKYKTGWLTENGVTTLSIYKKIYLYTIGTLTLNLYIDGTKVLDSIVLPSGFSEYNIPKVRGYYTEIEVQGTGELVEVDYTIENRSV